jgi:molecular chaperone GrpE
LKTRTTEEPSVSDAPRRDPATEQREDQTSAAGAHPDPQAPEPDALGAWPSAEQEAQAMPAERDAPAQEGAEPQDGAASGPAPQEAAAEDTRTREELLAALAEVEQQRDDYLDGVQRARAEFENYRRRTMREGASQRDAGKAELAEGLLEVLDDLDRTLDAAEASADESLARGVQLVAEKLVGALRSSGLERIDETGVAFDPNLHEAVQQTEADEPREQPVVAQMLRPGYLLGERVLRAAMVVVEQ